LGKAAGVLGILRRFRAEDGGAATLALIPARQGCAFLPAQERACGKFCRLVSFPDQIFVFGDDHWLRISAPCGLLAATTDGRLARLAGLRENPFRLVVSLRRSPFRKLFRASGASA